MKIQSPFTPKPVSLSMCTSFFLKFILVLTKNGLVYQKSFNNFLSAQSEDDLGPVEKK